MKGERHKIRKGLINFFICVSLIFDIIIPGTGIMIHKKISMENNLVFNNQFVVNKIKFNWGLLSNAIPIKNSKTGLLLSNPEYYPLLNRNNPAVYVRGRHIVVKVQFKSQEFYQKFSKVQIKATGSFGGVHEKEVTFLFDNSFWTKFTTINSIPDEINSYIVCWTWMYQDPFTSEWKRFDITTHTIYAINKKPVTRTIWQELVEWTTDWCKGLPDDDKQISDAILQGFVKDTVLRYGSSHMPCYTTRQVLKNGNGLCSVLALVFNDACATQGVKVVNFGYIVYSFTVKRWMLFTSNPGLGNIEPDKNLIMADTWKIVNEVYPYPRYYGFDNPVDDVEEENIRAYVFKGHCVNLLEYNGEVYLYDLSFGINPSESVFDDMPKQGRYTCDHFPNFKQNYLNILYQYMIGPIYYRNESGTLIYDANINFCVNASLIPGFLGDEGQITYYFLFLP